MSAIRVPAKLMDVMSSMSKKERIFPSKHFFSNLIFSCLSFFLDKVIDIEQGTISQVDPLGGRNSDFLYVVQYDI